MIIKTLSLLEGAENARGLTIIIDVFRAFSLECYLYDLGAAGVRPIGSLDDAFELKKRYPEAVLIGERGGRKCEGCDFGNSPCTIDHKDVDGRLVIHTTSAGTQGIVNARGASCLITGAFVNAKAVAAYVNDMDPEMVSIVAMGDAGIKKTNEDELCAEYLKWLIETDGGKKGSLFEAENFAAEIKGLRSNGGEKFFDSQKQDIFPENDFWMCTRTNIFDFVLKIEKDELGYCSKRVDIG